MSNPHASLHHLSSPAHQDGHAFAGSFDVPLKPNKTFGTYLRYAVQALSECDQAIPDIESLTLTVRAALSAQILLFASSLHDPDPIELHQFFEQFILAAAAPENRSRP